MMLLTKIPALVYTGRLHILKVTCVDTHFKENNHMCSTTEVNKIQRIKPGKQLLYPAQSPHGNLSH